MKIHALLYIIESDVELIIPSSIEHTAILGAVKQFFLKTNIANANKKAVVILG